LAQNSALAAGTAVVLALQALGRPPARRTARCGPYSTADEKKDSRRSSM